MISAARFADPLGDKSGDPGDLGRATDRHDEPDGGTGTALGGSRIGAPHRRSEAQ